MIQLHRSMPNQSPNPHSVPFVRYVIEFRHPLQVYQDIGPNETK